MRKVLSFVQVFMLAFSMAACGGSTSMSASAGGASASMEASKEASVSFEAETNTPAEPVTIKMGVPKAPPALPLLYMMEYETLGENVTIELDIWDEPETLIAMVQEGNHQMFAFPLTVVAKLHNKGVPVQLLNVNTWGVTYFITSDPAFANWEDLKGKTVYIPLQSSPPDALTQFFLNEAGLVPGEDVKIVYSSLVEVASMLISGEAEYAVLIEPQVTRALMQNENLRVAFSFEDEWKRLYDDNSIIPTAGIGAMSSFIDENPELAADFQQAYKEGVQWINDNPAEAGALAEKYLELNAELVEKAIPNMGLLFKNAQDARPEVEVFYNLLNGFDATMIGGSLPDESMYYHE